MIPGFKEFLRSTYNEQNEFFEASKYIYDEAQKQSIARDLLRQYEIESKRLFLGEEIKLARELDESEQLKKALIPKRWRRFFRRKENKAAVELELTVNEKLEAFFKGNITIDEILKPGAARGEAPGGGETTANPGKAAPAEIAEVSRQPTETKQSDTDNAAGLRPEPTKAGSTDTGQTPGQ